MGKKTNKILAGAREALAVAKGKKKAARITMIGWALYRDGQLYFADPKRNKMMGLARLYRPGSKHRWDVRRVRITTL